MMSVDERERGEMNAAFWSLGLGFVCFCTSTEYSMYVTCCADLH